MHDKPSRKDLNLLERQANYWIKYVYTGQFYHQIVFSSINQYWDPLSVLNGIISCKSLDGNWHIRGTASSNLGDSLGGWFESFTGDLLAINVGCDSIEVDGKITLEQFSSKHLAKSHFKQNHINKFEYFIKYSIIKWFIRSRQDSIMVQILVQMTPIISYYAYKKLLP